MILKCDCSWEEKIFEYIGNDYSKCLYIYMDIKKYGFNHNDINVWVDLDDGKNIKAIVFTYHNGMHIYSKKLDADWGSIVEIILMKKPTIICGVTQIIEILSKIVPCEYCADFGVVKVLNRSKGVTSDRVKKATSDDIDEMAEMLSKNSNDGYSLDERKKQLNERLNDSFSRSCLIYDNGKVITQASTNAEIDGIAIIAGVKCDENYRRQGLATEIVNQLCTELVNEKKTVYLVCYNDAADNMYTKIGFDTCEEWGKLYLKN